MGINGTAQLLFLVGEADVLGLQVAVGDPYDIM